MTTGPRQDTASPRRFKRSDEAATYIRDAYGLRCTGPTLTTLRCRGGGPRFYKAGNAVLYAVEDLDGWAVSRLGEPVRNTSEARSIALRASTTNAAAIVADACLMKAAPRTTGTPDEKKARPRIDEKSGLLITKLSGSCDSPRATLFHEQEDLAGNLNRIRAATANAVVGLAPERRRS